MLVLEATNALAVLNIIVSILAVTVAAIGVLFVAFVWFEWRQLAQIRMQMKAAKEELRQEIYNGMKAGQRVIASYGMGDPDAKISLLQTALAIDPTAFNAWNSLGYAWLEKGDVCQAIIAFDKAIAAHPQDKAGYCDLAYAQLRAGQEEAALASCVKAISLDASARQDLLADARFAGLRDKIQRIP